MSDAAQYGVFSVQRTLTIQIAACLIFFASRTMVISYSNSSVAVWHRLHSDYMIVSSHVEAIVTHLRHVLLSYQENHA